MAKTIGEMFDAARRVSVPLVVLRTSDQWAAQELLIKRESENVVLQWDAAVGISPLAAGVDGENEAASAWLKAQGKTAIGGDTTGFVDVIDKLRSLPQGAIVFAHNAHRQLNSSEPMGTAAAVQAVSNLRNAFKKNYRMLVLLGDLGFVIPPELVADVIVLDDDLPTHAALKTLVGELYDAGRQFAPSMETPTPEKLDAAAEALSGLPFFTAEQETAMSFDGTGLHIDLLWERKRKAIERTPGLSVWRGKERFDDLVGLDAIKTKLRQRIAGRRPLGVIVWIDEIDKALANVEHDTSGVRMYQLLKLLSEMENSEWTGFCGVGVPGAGKSLIAKALGNEAGVPTVALDLGASESSLVGESEGNLNRIMQVIKAIGRGNAYFVATSNAATIMRPELQRRFTDGFWMFDLMTDAERKAAWLAYIEKYNLGPQAALPRDDGWTGAEIRNCCRDAHDLNISLHEAAVNVLSMTQSRGDDIEGLRKYAHGRFLDAAKGGTYAYDPRPMKQQLRALNLSDAVLATALATTPLQNN